jgi:hypothetical protein
MSTASERIPPIVRPLVSDKAKKALDLVIPGPISDGYTLLIHLRLRSS